MKQIVSYVQVITNIASKHFAAWLVLILMLLVMTETISRYVFGSPLMVADEVGGYLLVAIVIIGLAYTWQARGHISIETFVSRLPTKVRNWLRLITLIMATALVPVLINASYELVAFSFKFGFKRESWLRTPLAWPQIVLIIGFSLLLLQLIVELVKAIRAVRTPVGED